MSLLARLPSDTAFLLMHQLRDESRPLVPLAAAVPGFGADVVHSRKESGEDHSEIVFSNKDK